jgi:hypothetical protein
MIMFASHKREGRCYKVHNIRELPSKGNTEGLYKLKNCFQLLEPNLKAT